jgi:hypothetical protein
MRPTAERGRDHEDAMDAERVADCSADETAEQARRAEGRYIYLGR